MVRELFRWELGGMSGIVIDDSETFKLDNLESEVVTKYFISPEIY